MESERTSNATLTSSLSAANMELSYLKSEISKMKEEQTSSIDYARYRAKTDAVEESRSVIEGLQGSVTRLANESKQNKASSDEHAKGLYERGVEVGRKEGRKLAEVLRAMEGKLLESERRRIEGEVSGRKKRASLEEDEQRWVSRNGYRHKGYIHY